MFPYYPKLAFPASPLCELIHHYEWLEIEPDDSGHQLVTHASISTGLMFVFHPEQGAAIRQTNNCRQALSRANLILPREGYGSISTKQSITVFRVIFQPGALFSVYGVPIQELRNCHSSIESLGDPMLTQLADAMSGQVDFAESIAWFEAYAQQKMTAIHCSPLFHRLMSTMDTHQETSKATGLASHLATSPRSLNRNMSQELGFSPKTFLQTRRFCQALRYLDNHAEEPLSEVGLRFNYFDQAHFIHDFRKKLGCTPRQARTIFHPAQAMKQVAPTSRGWKLLQPNMSHLYNFAA